MKRVSAFDLGLPPPKRARVVGKLVYCKTNIGYNGYKTANNNKNTSSFASWGISDDDDSGVDEDNIYTSFTEHRTKNTLQATRKSKSTSTSISAFDYSSINQVDKYLKIYYC